MPLTLIVKYSYRLGETLGFLYLPYPSLAGQVQCAFDARTGSAMGCEV